MSSPMTETPTVPLAMEVAVITDTVMSAKLRAPVYVSDNWPISGVVYGTMI